MKPEVRKRVPSESSYVFNLRLCRGRSSLTCAYVCVCAGTCMCPRDEAHWSAWPFPTNLELVVLLEYVQVKLETQAGGLQSDQGSQVQSFPKKQMDIYAQAWSLIQ